MKLLFCTDYVRGNSAYAQQAALFLPRLRAAGHDVALLATGLYAGPPFSMPDGMPVFSCAYDPYGNDIVLGHAKLFGAQALLTLGDPHCFDPAVYGQMPWIAWAPCDYTPPTERTLHALRGARWVWSPSKHAEAMYKDAGLSDVTYVPHGIDTKVFCPGDRTVARKEFGKAIGRDLTGRFLIVSVGANKGTPSRKGFFEMFSAMKKFSEICSEALLYLHSEPTGAYGGENLYRIMDLVGLDSSRIVFPHRYEHAAGLYGPEYLSLAYRAADVYLSASHAEGFGIPAVEAQACGTPVVLSDNSAQTEHCFTGMLARCTEYMPCEGVTKWCRPDVQNLCNSLSAMADSQPMFGTSRDLVSQRVAQFDVDRVLQDHMLPALRRVEECLS